jgi:hypothetical protein
MRIDNAVYFTPELKLFSLLELCILEIRSEITNNTDLIDDTNLDVSQINELFNTEKFFTLCEQIDKSTATEDEKHFLKMAAHRHVVFDYENIAEFYSHSPKYIQDLMEKSALVIIDFDKAIENGFVEMSESIAAIYKADVDADK